MNKQGMQGAEPRFSDRNDQPLGGVMIEASLLNLDSHPDARLEDGVILCLSKQPVAIVRQLM